MFMEFTDNHSVIMWKGILNTDWKRDKIKGYDARNIAVSSNMKSDIKIMHVRPTEIRSMLKQVSSCWILLEGIEGTWNVILVTQRKHLGKGICFSQGKEQQKKHILMLNLCPWYHLRNCWFSVSLQIQN